MPIVPNYNNGVGQLVVDRYDFQDHVEGNDLRHAAASVDLSPPVVIDGYTKNTVQQAIETLATGVNAVVPVATTTTRGIVQLSGDLSGTATNVTVSSLRGFPVSNSVPSSDDLLTWDGTAWSPRAASGLFTAGGDLSGSNSYQEIIRITGNGSSQVQSLAKEVVFDSSLNYVSLYQEDTNAGSGSSFYIQAQNSLLNSSDGGDVVISGGQPGSGGKPGGVITYTSSKVMLEANTLSTGNRVLGLLPNSTLNITKMPANTGDMVIYIGDAITSPSNGANPVDGSILYSQNGKLRTKFYNGDDFELGTNNNPHAWGPTGQQVYNYRLVVQTIGTAQQDVFTYLVPNNYSVKVDVTVVGKEVSNSSNESYQTDVSNGFARGSSSPTVDYVGALAYYDERYTSGATFWTKPDIVRSLASLKIRSGTGDVVGQIVNWIFDIKLTIIEAV